MTIEQIGAVCTIIAEYFKKYDIEISRESAILLYYGIVSYTVNCASSVTTKRDKEMANCLSEKCSEVYKSLVSKIFLEKSKVDLKNLRAIMEVDEKFSLGDDEVIIGQLEIVNAHEFLVMNKNILMIF